MTIKIIIEKQKGKKTFNISKEQCLVSNNIYQAGIAQYSQHCVLFEQNIVFHLKTLLFN